MAGDPVADVPKPPHFECERCGNTVTEARLRRQLDRFVPGSIGLVKVAATDVKITCERCGESMRWSGWGDTPVPRSVAYPSD